MSDYSLSAKITGDASGFITAINKATDALKDLGKKVSDSTSKISEGAKSWGLDLEKFYNKGSSIFKNFGVDIDQFASHFGASGALVAGITAVTVALQKLGAEMNEASAEIVKGTGATGDALIQLKDDMNTALVGGISQDIKTVGTMVADINTRFGSTGEELTKLTDRFGEFAVITGTDVKTAINSVADATKKWGLSNEEILPLMDQLTKASQMSGASVSELLSGLKTGQAVFSQFGMSATESTAFLASLSASGIDTSNALTGLRTALANFSKAGVDAKTGLEQVSNAIRNASTESEALNIAVTTFGTRSGAEFVKILQSGTESADAFMEAMLKAGGAVKDTSEVARTSKQAITELLNSLKSTFSGFGEGVDNLLTDILDSFRNLVELIAPVIQPIGKVFSEVFSFIGELIKTLVSYFVEFHKRFNTVWKGVADVLQTTYEAIHKILGNVLQVVGDVFGMIFAIIDGKWEVAWLYAKRVLLTFADSLAGILSWVVNLVAKAINLIIKPINALIDGFNLIIETLNYIPGVSIPAAQKLGELGDVDFSDAWGITEALQTVTQEIDEATGKSAEKITANLGEVQTVTTEIADTVSAEWEDAFKKMENSATSWEDKYLTQQIKLEKKALERAVELARIEGKSEAEIYQIKKDGQAKINKLLEEQIDREEQAELAKIEALEKTIGVTEETQATRKKIEDYYTNERKMLYEEDFSAFKKAEGAKADIIEEIAETEEQSNEKALEAKQHNYSWDIRLLEQQKAAAQTDKERNEIQEQIYELQRKQALASADINDYAKINEYYDNLIADLTEERADAMGKVAEAEEQARQSAEKSAEAKATNYSWDLKLLQLDLEEATRAKEKERIQKEIYEMQREESLARADIADHAKINEYYDRLIKGLIQDQNEALEEQAELYEDVENSRNGGAKSATPNKEAEERAAAMQKLAEMEQSWNDKLLSQKIALAESERQLDSHTYEAQAYHIDRILKLKQEQLENERQAALANIEDTEENAALRASIEKYYDNESAQMYRDSLVEKEKYRDKDVKEERSLWDKSLEYAKKAVSAMKSVVSGISNVIGTAISGAINIVGKLWSGFVSMLDFNPDDALMGLLEFEDKILSFFYNVLPKIPAFIASAFQSISVLLDTVFDSVDFGGMFDAIAGAVAGIFSKLPSMIKKSLPKLMSAIKTLLKSFKNILPDLLNTGMELVKMLFNELPRFIQAELPSLVQAIIGVIPQLMGAGSQLVTGIAQALPMLLDGVLKAFIAILQNPSQIGDLISALTQAIVALIKTVLTNLPQLISGLVDLLTEVLKAIPDIIIGLLTDPEVWKSVARSFVNILLAPINMAIGLLNKIPFVNIPKLDASNWFADGTNSAPRGLAVVGESGPELVDFRGGEKVYNNTNTEKMLAGAKSGNTFNVTFNNTVDTSAYQMMRQLKQYNREMAFNGVL